MSQFNLEIITPERSFFSGEVDSITLTTLSGRIQILAHHISYATGVMPSVVKIKVKDEYKYATVTGGFLEFSNNKAIILADGAEWPEEIDEKRAEEALNRAKDRLHTKANGLDKKRAQMALLRATARIKVSELRKH